jgi:hypothetical protein
MALLLTVVWGARQPRSIAVMDPRRILEFRSRDPSVVHADAHASERVTHSLVATAA